MRYLIENARAVGEISLTQYRTVIDQDGNITVHDFDDLGSARQYAADAASEYGEAPTVAIAVDSDFEIVHEGRPYFAP